MDTPFAVILITAPNTETAERIARELVEQRLAACCNVVTGLRSIYRWKGEICTDPEVLLIVKSRVDCFEKITVSVKALHPYEVPEIISLAITNGQPDYLKWLADSLD